MVGILHLRGKPMIPHLQRCQRFAVDDYGFTLDALDLGHPQLSLKWDTIAIKVFK